MSAPHGSIRAESLKPHALKARLRNQGGGPSLATPPNCSADGTIRRHEASAQQPRRAVAGWCMMAWFTLIRHRRALTAALLALAAVLAGALFPSWPAHAQTAQTVQSDWSLIPTGVTAGQSFRLLFLTSTGTATTATGIASYNTHVQNAANTNNALKDFKDEFRALVSTSATDARANTLTRSTDTDAPIYWVNGAKVADNYADFYDGSWDSRAVRNESGTRVTGSVVIATGSAADGTKHSTWFMGNSSAQVKSAFSNANSPVSWGSVTHGSRPIYALSPVITVQGATDTTGPSVTGALAITSEHGTYTTDDVIEVTVTFDQAIVVVGTPELKIMVGAAEKTATCTRKGSTGDDAKKLVCTYTIIEGDEDTNGLSVGANKLSRPSGVTIKDASDNDANLAHAALPAQSAHKVDAKAPSIVGLAMASTPAAAGVYAASEVIKVEVTFSEEVHVEIGAGETITLGLEVGTANKSAACAHKGDTGEDAKKLVCSYTVADGDNDADGVRVPAGSLTSSSDDDAYIEDGQGIEAVYSHTGLAAQSGHKVDTAGPTPPTDQTVQPGWQYIPSGVTAGQSFRLLFMTSTKTAATSASISTYNSFVQARAAANTHLAGFSSEFRALVSTATVHARDNTATTGTGVPIYWLGGELVDSDYTSFYDGLWTSYAAKDESGSDLPSGSTAWTGSNADGTKRTGDTAGHGSGFVIYGQVPPDIGHGPIYADSTRSFALDRLYALSPVITVRATPTNVPDRPGDLDAVADSTGVTLSWTDTKDPSGSGVTKHQYQQKAGNDAWDDWTDIPNSAANGTTVFRVTGLTSGTTYFFRVRAVNANGNGAASETVRATPSRATAPTVTGVKILSRAEGSVTTTLVDGRFVHSRTGRGDTYVAREKIWIEVTFSSARIAVEGRPVLELHVGGTSADPVVRYADFLCLFADNRAVFEYRTVYADKDKDGISVPENALLSSVDTDRIYDPRTDEDVNPNHAGLEDDPDHKVNGLLGLPKKLKAPPMPTLAKIKLRSKPADPDRGYVTGEEIRLDAIFTKAIPTVEGKPTLELQVGTETRRAEFKEVRFRSSDRRRWMMFRYTVQAGDSDADGISIPANPIATNAADRIYRSWDREPAALAFAGLGAQARHKVNASVGMGQQGPVDAVSAPPLTARLESAPSAHKGQGRFLVRLAFSAPVAARPQDAGFRVSGGTVTRARRVEGSEARWQVRIKPDSLAAVTLTLPATTDCAAAGAVCTADGRKLENPLTHTVPGPATLSVADARAKEGEDATIDFPVTLSRAVADAVTVRYATRDGTAQQGADYRRARGTLTFQAGETEKTVAVALLDDAHDEGEETFTLTLSKAKGAVITDGEAVGTIENSDPLQRAWLARFGRTVGTHVTDAVGERLRGAPGQDSHVTIGGSRLPLRQRKEADQPSVLEAVAGVLGLGLPGANPLSPDGRRQGEGAGHAFGNTASAAAPDPRLGQSQSVNLDLRQILLGSSFRLNLGAADADASLPRLTAWGRFAGTTFDGQDGTLSLNGDVFTGTVGVDGTWDRLLAGVAVAHSRGDGSFSMPGTEDRGRGDLEQTLTSLHPYLRYAVTDRLDVWGLVGYGWGELDLEMADGVTYETDTTLVMGAFGGRGILLAPAEAGGFQLATRTDAMLTRTSADAVAGLASSDGDAHRLRLVLEGSRGVTWADGRSLTPTVELGLRHDWGDAETGFGLELGGRVQYADPRLGLTIEGAARALLAHEDDAYEEWGAWGTVRVAPGADGRGLALTLAPAWGATASGVEGLWARQTTAGLAPTGPRGPAAGRLTAEVGYGVVGPPGLGVVTPYGGVTLAQGGTQQYRLGGRWVVEDGLTLNLEGAHQQPGGQTPADTGLLLRLEMPW